MLGGLPGILEVLRNEVTIMILLWTRIEALIALTAFGGSSSLIEPGVGKLEQTQRGKGPSTMGAE